MIQRTPIAPLRPGAKHTPVIYYIRHGETDWNRQGRLQGGHNIPLNDLGRRQAREVAQHLRDAAGVALDSMPWIVSPMDRAQETARICRSALGFDANGFTTLPGLTEITFGTWEGMTWKEVRKADPGRAAQRTADKWGYVPPGGESYAMVHQRTKPVFDALTVPTVVVAHGGIARALLWDRTEVNEADAAVFDIWQGRVMVFDAAGATWVP